MRGRTQEELRWFNRKSCRRRARESLPYRFHVLLHAHEWVYHQISLFSKTNHTSELDITSNCRYYTICNHQVFVYIATNFTELGRECAMRAFVPGRTTLNKISYLAFTLIYSPSSTRCPGSNSRPGMNTETATYPKLEGSTNSMASERRVTTEASKITAGFHLPPQITDRDARSKRRVVSTNWICNDGRCKCSHLVWTVINRSWSIWIGSFNMLHRLNRTSIQSELL